VFEFWHPAARTGDHQGQILIAKTLDGLYDHLFGIDHHRFTI
jgi:hypothetical protein